MVKVTVSGFGIGCKNCVVSETETPNGILRHFHLNPDAKIVYIDGKILSRKMMETPFGKKNHVFMIAHNKIRD